MKIYNNTNITYSAIEHNSRKNTKQNFPADLEKKMTQYTDTVSISKTGQEKWYKQRQLKGMCRLILESNGIYLGRKPL